jgi:competence protein ComFC
MIALAVEARPRRRPVDLGPGKTLDVHYSLRYSPRVSGLMTQMKYGDKPGLSALLVPFIDLALPEGLVPGTMLVPVPIHASKRRDRGYNQSGLLASALARRRGLTMRDALVKTKATVAQAGLARDRRIGNLSGTMVMRDAGRAGFERAILVDDVVTTGSTLRECARALEAAGIKEISACTVAASF